MRDGLAKAVLTVTKAKATSIADLPEDQQRAIAEALS
jgi:hypothetical protein